MANKKCPKCGEDNPAEAVMCWACYTPLSGAAPLSAGAAALPATAGMGSRPGGAGGDLAQDDKKAVDPKIIGVGALLLIGVVVAGVVTFGMGGGSTSPDVTVVPGADPNAPIVPAPAPPTAPVPVPVPVPVPGGAVVAPVPLPFQTVVQPNPSYLTGTVGILATQPNVTQGQAVGLAKSARNQFMANGRWKNMQIAVFTDPNSAKGFQTYQAGRKSAPLTAADYQALADQGVWTGAAAFYETVGRQEYPSFPKGNPTGWWSRSR